MVRRPVVAVAIAIATLLTTDFLRVQWHRTDADRDLAVYHWAADQLRDDLPLYQKHEGPHVPTFAYIYPPVLASTLSLLPRTDFVTFARGWIVFLTIVFWVAAGLCAHIALGR